MPTIVPPSPFVQSTSDLAQEEMEKSMNDFMEPDGGGAESPFEFS